ncbi:MAG: hypothetical protein NTV55_09785 [Planctomycetota bacterium]|nr:hypothetical protein [Planctomycetota bacterium]
MPLVDDVEFDDFKKIITCGEFHLVTFGAPNLQNLPAVPAPTAGTVAITSLGADSSIHLASENLELTCGATKLSMMGNDGIVFNSDKKFLTTVQGVPVGKNVSFLMDSKRIGLTFGMGDNLVAFNMNNNLVSLNIGAKSSIIMADDGIKFNVGGEAGTTMQLTANGIVITAPSVEYNLTQQHKVTVGPIEDPVVSTHDSTRITETVGSSMRQLNDYGHQLKTAETLARIVTNTVVLKGPSITLQSDATIEQKTTMNQGNSDTLWTLVAKMFKWN